MLQFDWDEAKETPIRAVLCREESRMSAGTAQWERLAFVIGEKAVVLTVNDETDEVLVALEAASETEGWDEVPSLSFAEGRTFGWCWIGRNYRGYLDTFTVAFGDVVPDALTPRWMFLGEGSALTCPELTPHRL